jgi:hypothetical protein
MRNRLQQNMWPGKYEKGGTFSSTLYSTPHLDELDKSHYREVHLSRHWNNRFFTFNVKSKQVEACVPEDLKIGNVVGFLVPKQTTRSKVKIGHFGLITDIDQANEHLTLLTPTQMPIFVQECSMSENFVDIICSPIMFMRLSKEKKRPAFSY